MRESSPFGKYLADTREGTTFLLRSLTHSSTARYGHRAHGPRRGNKLVFLQDWPFQVSQGVTRAECVIPAHVVIVAEPPGQLSWENTEPGSGCPRTDPDLRTHKDPWGPPGRRKIIPK